LKSDLLYSNQINTCDSVMIWINFSSFGFAHHCFWESEWFYSNLCHQFNQKLEMCIKNQLSLVLKYLTLHFWRMAISGFIVMNQKLPFVF